MDLLIILFGSDFADIFQRSEAVVNFIYPIALSADLSLKRCMAVVLRRFLLNDGVN